MRYSYTGLREILLSIVLAEFSLFFFLYISTMKLKKLTQRYRMVLLNEDDFTEIGNIRLTRLNAISFAGISTTIFIVVIYLLLLSMGYIDTEAQNFFIVPISSLYFLREIP